MHKATWISPDHTTESQIDHICINKNFRGTIEDRPVKDKEGKPITEIQQQRNRWVEQFEELLNGPAPINPPDIEAAHIDLPIDVNPPTTEEIRMAIRKIKSGKAAEPDNIPAEALRSYIEIPTIDLSKCENYRSITLLSIPGKVFNGVLLNRIKDVENAQLQGRKVGFLDDRSCTDQSATLRIIVERSVELNSSMCINFINYERAFDNVDRTLWQLLRHYKVPEMIVSIIRKSYDGLQCKVVHGGQLTDAL
ncbi:unnamed protein product [Schistosoma curassoni]|uniref:Reverse transcriptase domain-containing protein n=1 Tax=Schistosoma curassoni TaxID=6186 RepID=A0A183KS42_9TREM|nr:unnamed protein product [Schistosoma curassoni]